VRSKKTWKDYRQDVLGKCRDLGNKNDIICINDFESDVGHE